MCAEMPAHGVALSLVRAPSAETEEERNARSEEEEEIESAPEVKMGAAESRGEGRWKQMEEQDEWRLGGRGEEHEDEDWMEALEASDRLGVV